MVHSMVEPFKVDGTVGMKKNKKLTSMKKVFVITLSAIALLASCAKEVDNPEKPVVPKGKKLVTIIAQTPDTKTTVAVAVEGNVAAYSWQEDEHIAVVEEDATAPSTDFSINGDNLATGAFTGTVTEGKDLLYAVSPAGALTAGTPGGYTITLPGTYENYVPGTTNAVMFGTPDGEPEGDTYKFTFDHMAALVKVTYVNVPLGTKYFTFSTDKNINGSYSQNSTSIMELGELSDGGNETLIELEDAVVVPNQTMDFYVPVPADTYGEFEIALYDEDIEEISGTRKSKKGLELVLNVGDLFVTPTITLAPQYPYAGEWIMVGQKDDGYYAALAYETGNNVRGTAVEVEGEQVASDQPSIKKTITAVTEGTYSQSLGR